MRRNCKIFGYGQKAYQQMLHGSSLSKAIDSICCRYQNFLAASIVASAAISSAAEIKS